MPEQDLRLMLQDSVNLIGILDDFQNEDAEHLMGSMVHFVNQVNGARKIIVEQMRGDRDPEIIYRAMMHPSPIVTRLHADDLLEVTARAGRSFAHLVDAKDAKLDAQASATIAVWVNVADQSLIAIKLLFQISRLYGRAPNGKLLKSPDELSSDDISDGPDIFTE